MAMAPGVASAQTQPEAIDTSVICGDVQSNFDDIAGSAHEYNVRCMADFGLTEGLAPDGTSYGPRLDVTRGQMASFIARFIEDYNEQALPPGNPARFDDVPPTDAQYVHASNIHKLAAIEVVEGTNASDGQSYAPNANVTRGQMASFIRRALSYLDNGDVNPLSEPPAGPDAFPDDDGSVHEPNINALAGVRIVEGFEDGDYRPLALVKRDQMASFVMRAYAWADAEGLGDEDPPPGEEPSVEVTTDADSLAAGDSFTATFTGDVDDIQGVTVAGDCVVDGDVNLDDGVATVATEDESDAGPCEVTFTVTFDDDTEQEHTVTLTIEGALNDDSGESFAGLQEAIDEAADGDTIHAYGSFDGPIAISAPVTVEGHDATLDGGFGISNTDGVTITGFTVTPGSIPGAGEDAAFYLTNVSEVEIRDNVVVGTGTGTGVLNASGGGDEEATIADNSFTGLLRGAFANPTADFTITGNTFDGNVVGSANDAASVITGNTFLDNGEGIGLGAAGSTVTGNMFDGNDDHVCDYTGTYVLATLIAANEFADDVVVDGNCIVDA